MREKEIEEKLVSAVKAKKGLCWKFTSPGTAGVPDRIVLMPGGSVVFAELKAPGKKMRLLQLRRKQQLEALGFRVYCIDSKESIEDFIRKEVMPNEVHTSQLPSVCD